MALARPLTLPVVALLAVPLAGCPVLDRLSGNATIDLSRAQLRRMNVQLRKPEQTVCPREQVQLGIFLTAVPENGKDEKTFETWVGRGAVNKNDRLAFTDFSFETAQGQVDKDGWLAPQEQLQATAGQEIAVKVTYNPSRFSQPASPSQAPGSFRNRNSVAVAPRRRPSSAAWAASASAAAPSRLSGPP